MSERVNGRISIGRTSGGDPELPPIKITLYDASTGKRIMEARMHLESFALALTGVAELDCAIQYLADDKGRRDSQ